MSEWTPSRQGLPQAGARVLVSHDRQVFIARRSGAQWIEGDFGAVRLYARRPDDAWMALPKPLEGGE